MNKLILLFTCILLLNSCSTLQYKYYNPKLSNTSDYKSFVVVNNCEATQSIISDQQQEQVISTFKQKMTTKGLQPEGNQIADLIISFYVKANYYEVEDVCYDNYEDYILGPICKAKVVTYEVNTLVIDFFDTEKNTVVFHSAIEGLNFTKADKFQETLSKAVSEILNEFDSNKNRGV